MFGAMTSLTGGGGLSASGGDATSGNGDQTYGGTHIGGLNFGVQGQGSGMPPWIWLAALAIVALLVLKK